MILDHAMWLVTGASIVGTVANVHHKRWCFWVWAATNALWCMYDIAKTAYPQAALMAVYFGLSVYGLRTWAKGRA